MQPGKLIEKQDGCPLWIKTVEQIDIEVIECFEPTRCGSNWCRAFERSAKRQAEILQLIRQTGSVKVVAEFEYS